MNVEVKKINKKVKLLTGKTVERKGTVKLAVLDSVEAVTALLGEDVAVFAAFGYRAFVRQSANNAISGSGKKDKELRSALRNFRSSLETAIKHFDLSESDAVEYLLNKEAFATVKSYTATLSDSNDSVALDYSVAFPVPKFAAMDEEDADEDDD